MKYASTSLVVKLAIDGARQNKSAGRLFSACQKAVWANAGGKRSAMAGLFLEFSYSGLPAGFSMAPSHGPALRQQARRHLKQAAAIRAAHGCLTVLRCMNGTSDSMTAASGGDTRS